LELKILALSLAVAFLLALICGPLLIPMLRRLKFGQQVRDDGPQRHLAKSGTPTMGGIIIVVALSIAALAFTEWNTELALLLVATLGSGLIGFLDDFIKIVKKRSLGLTALQKLIGQTVVALVVYVLFIQSGGSTALHIPGLEIAIELGDFHIYALLVIIMMLATTNAVNFTDGLDGLLAGTGAIAFTGYAILAILASQYESAVFSFAMIGALLGFLVFNAHPAKVFMGDTGSLAIGGGLVAVAMLTKAELLLIIIGGVFVIEMLSVIIQVVSFKTRGKRVFKMSPIHHHYEMSGWSEWKVVTVFWIAGILFALLGLYINGVFGT
jgi:phospho-N-acetylmuramoyl-pentapeptide-transferase